MLTMAAPVGAGGTPPAVTDGGDGADIGTQISAWAWLRAVCKAVHGAPERGILGTGQRSPARIWCGQWRIGRWGAGGTASAAAGSAADQPHVRFFVVVAGGPGEVVELADLLGGQLGAVGGGVLLDPGDPLGAGYRGDVVALG